MTRIGPSLRGVPLTATGGGSYYSALGNLWVLIPYTFNLVRTMSVAGGRCC